MKSHTQTIYTLDGTHTGSAASLCGLPAIEMPMDQTRPLPKMLVDDHIWHVVKMVCISPGTDLEPGYRAQTRLVPRGSDLEVGMNGPCRRERAASGERSSGWVE